MLEHHPLLLALITGILSGFLFSIPVGPINVAVINESARRGAWAALMIGVGAVAMEIIYCALSFAGSTQFLDSRVARAVMELASFLMMVFLGVKYLIAPRIETASPHSVEVIEHTLHPRTAFTIGFVRVLGNPGVLLLWLTMAATFISHDWVDNAWASKATCVAGIAIGALCWFVILSYTISLGHGKFSTRTLLALSHFSGAGLLFIAVVVGARLVLLLARR